MGGVCRISPVNCLVVSLIISSVIPSKDLKFSGSLSRSYVGVTAPRVMVPVYSFSWAIYSFILLVNFPVQTIKSPVANGSSVPACPTFLIFIVLRIFLITSNDVQSNGLSISKTLPSSKVFSIIVFYYLCNFHFSTFPYLVVQIACLAFNSKYLLIVFTVSFWGEERIDKIPYLDNSFAISLF